MDIHQLANAAPLLCAALGQTLLIAAIVIVSSFVLGLALAELGQLGGRPLALTVRCLIEAVRGIPLLVFVFLTYYLLPKLGVNIETIYSGCVALSLFFAVYVAEVFRGAFRTISKVQSEAGMALGMRGWQVRLIIILPQALRISLPSLMNLAAIIIKATSVVSIIGVWELTLATQEIVMRTLSPFTFFVVALIMYFVLCYGTVRLGAHLSKRLDRSQRA